MKITIDWLEQEDACPDAINWARPFLGKDGKSLSGFLLLIERADWLLWLLWHTKAINLRQMVWLSSLCGRQSLRHVQIGVDRTRLAYEAAEKWVINPNNETARAAEYAADAACAANNVAGAVADTSSAAGTAWAAAWEAGAAGDTACAARKAAEAAWAAADTASAAARAAAREAVATRVDTEPVWDIAWESEHKKMCNLILKEIEKEEFKKLVLVD